MRYKKSDDVKYTHAGSIAAMCGMSPMVSALSLNPSNESSPIYILPRFSDKYSRGGRDWRVPVEVSSQLWLIHSGNAYETREDNGDLKIQIQASACSYRWFDFQKMFGKLRSHQIQTYIRLFRNNLFHKLGLLGCSNDSY